MVSVGFRGQKYFRKWKWLLLMGVTFIAAVSFLDINHRLIEKHEVDFPPGLKLNRVDPEHEKKIVRNIRSFADGVYRLSPGDLLIGRQFMKKYPHAYHFQGRTTDIFTISYPKTGSTWMQEILWTLLHNQNLDSPLASESVTHRVPFFDIEFLYATEELGTYWDTLIKRHKVDTIMDLHQFLPNPRIFKTHLYFNLLNPKVFQNSKFIYIIRHPADVCLSYFHFAKNRKRLSYQDPLEDFVTDFLNGDYQYGSYLEHLKQWWMVKSRENIHTVYYEQLVNNTLEELERISVFLGLSLSRKQLEKIEKYVSFDEMRERSPKSPSKNYQKDFNFYRSGKAGSSKEEMPEQLLRKICDHYHKHLGQIRLPYDFE